MQHLQHLQRQASIATTSVAALLASTMLLAHTALLAAEGPQAAPSAAASAASAPAGEASAYVQFTEDFTATCVARNGVQVQVKSSHPSRKIRVWLDRIHMGVGTGDRSRTDLLPGAEPAPLGCSRSTTGTQTWQLVRAQFVD